MTNPQLWIFGAGSLARLAKFYFQNDVCRPVTGFVVDDNHLSAASSDLGKVVGWTEFKETISATEVELFPAVGYKSMRAREVSYQRLVTSKASLCNLVCKDAYIASDARLGSGVFIMPGVVIEPGVTIGDNNVFWSNSTVCHDSTIGNHNFFSAGTVVGGGARVSARCFFGFSSVVAQYVHVGSDVLVGSHAFLKKNAESAGAYLGVPAVLKYSINSTDGVSVSP
jgi:sugar O-acyltransferase (sialic acid O-acetyltransferase NeuD family)